jgi:hypothetical protein
VSVLRIEYPSTTELIVELDVDTPSAERRATYRQSGTPPTADIVRSVYELSRLLAGETVHLLKFADWTKQLRVRPDGREPTSVTVDVIGTAGEPEVSAQSTRAEVCRALIDGGRSYLDLFCEGGVDQTDDRCRCTELEVGVIDAERRLARYLDHGTQEGYEPTIDDQHLEQFIGCCVNRDRLREHVRRTDRLEPFVRNLPERDDDEFVAGCYENLLGYYDELRRPTLKALTSQPDDRAREDLLMMLWAWAGTPELVAVVGALEPILDSHVVDSLVQLLADYSSDPDALVACVAAAEILSSAEITELLGPSEISCVRTTLKGAHDAATDPDLQQTIAAVMDGISDS